MIENLYNLVRENKWTIDKFYSIAKETAKDLNGDGKLGLDDVAGILSSNDKGRGFRRNARYNFFFTPV